MRDNFERFGYCLYLETWKRNTNALLCPCLVTSLNNELGTFCLGCEAIMLREQIDACKNILDFIFDACPRRVRDEVSILSGDGFFKKEDLANMFHLSNAQFIVDFYHLLDSVLEEKIWQMRTCTFRISFTSNGQFRNRKKNQIII